MTAGQFCWLDLAAANADTAKTFYRRVFGWTSIDQAASGGLFTRLRQAGQDVGSLYQLSRAQLDHGVPSHWTPYIRVEDIDEAISRVTVSGGEIVVHPFMVPHVARIALIIDSIGAPVGLWEPLPLKQEREFYG